MASFKVWKDGEESEAVTVNAQDMNDALDYAAVEFGYSDYADMALTLGWDSEAGDGLNIKAIED